MEVMKMLAYPPFAGQDLEHMVSEAFDRRGVPDNVRTKAKALLAPLREKHPSTHGHYLHSLRVGLLCEAIAEVVHLDPKACLFPGLLHDVGKALVPVSVLGKTEAWDEDDQRIMSGHVMDGYRLVRDCFTFSAEVMVYHHQFQPNRYPKRLPRLQRAYSPGTKVTIPLCGRILALADVYDALHRINYKGGKQVVRTGEEIKEAMLCYNEDQVILVRTLYKEGVFTIETVP